MGKKKVKTKDGEKEGKEKEADMDKGDAKSAVDVDWFIPKSAMSLDEFKDKILKPKGVNFTDFVASADYNKLKSTEFGKAITEEAHEKGMNPGLAGEAAPISSVPEEKTVVVMQPKVVADEVERPGESAATIPPAAAFTAFKPVFRDHFISCLAPLEVSKTKKKYLLQIKDEFKIGDWSTYEEYLHQYMMWQFKILEKYDGVIMDVPWETSIAYDKRETQHDKMGYNVFVEVDKMWNLDRDRAVDKLHSGTHLDANVKGTLQNVMAAGLPSEIKLQTKLSDMNMNYGSTDPLLLRDLYRKLDSNRTFTGMMPNEFLPDYQKVWHIPVNTSYQQMMDLMTDFRLQVYATFRSLVIERMKLDIFSSITTFKQLMSTLRINTTQFDPFASLPGDIVSSRAEQLFAERMASILLGRWFVLDYYVDPREYDDLTLIECVLMKMLFKSSELQLSSRIAIQNYILVNLFMRAPDFKTHLLDVNLVYTSNEDWLTRVLNSPTQYFGNKTGEYCRLLRPYFSMDNMGSGWAGAGQNPKNREYLDPRFSRFHNAPFVHEAIFGKLKNYDDRIIYQQLQNYSLFVEWISQYGGRWVFDRNRYDKIFRLLTVIAQRTSSLNYMAIQMDEFERVMAYNSMVFEATDDEKDAATRDYILVSDPDYKWLNANMRTDAALLDALAEGRMPLNAQAVSLLDKAATPVYDKTRVARTIYQIERGAIASMCFTVNWKGLIDWPPNNDLLDIGWSFNNMILEFTSLYAYIRTRTPSAIYGKVDRIKMALDMMKDNILKSAFKDAFLDMPHTWIVPMGGTRFFLEKMSMIDEFTRDIKPLFGFTDEVYFNPKFDTSMLYKDAFKIYSIAQMDHGTKIIDYKQFIDLILLERVWEVTREALERGETLKFSIPVKLSYTDSPTINDFENQRVYDWSGNHITNKGIKLFFMWYDDERRLNEFGLVRYPTWSTPTPPFVLIDMPTFTGLMVQVITRARLEWFDTKLIKRYTRYGNPLKIN